MFDGKQQARLRSAILDGFTLAELRRALRENLNLDLHDIVSSGPDPDMVDELIGHADRHGKLITICEVLAQARFENAAVRGPILAVLEYLRDESSRLKSSGLESESEPSGDQLNVVLSSVDPDAAWKSNFEEHFTKAIQPCRVIGTLERMKQSKEAVSGLRKDIEDAQIFIALISKRYVRFQQTVDEIEYALRLVERQRNASQNPRRLLAVLLDREGAEWFESKRRKLASEGAVGDGSVVVGKFFDQNGRKSIVSAGKLDDKVVELIVNLGEQLRGAFGQDDIPDPAIKKADVGNTEAEDLSQVSMSDKIVILGESRNKSDPAAAAAIDALVEDLTTRGAPIERWPDGWRASRRTMDVLAGRPTFVRTTVDQSVTGANELSNRLSSELKVSFGLEFDDETEHAAPIRQCPHVLWRPGGPDWRPAGRGPLIYSSVDEPPELARWLVDLLGLASIGGRVPMVRYEDPVEAKNPDRTVRRRQALENTLLSVVEADTVPVGHGHLLEVVSRIDGRALTIIAAHDLDTKIDDERDTISRFQSLDRGIEQSLTRTQSEQAPLLLVAALFRNAKLFPQFEFSRETRIRRWQLLRFFEGPDGTYLPDAENLDRLREQIAVLSRSNGQRVSP